MPTVRDTTHSLLRSAGVRTIFGNPGSNELPFLADLPDDVSYVLALHEGAAVGMADGYAQAGDRLGVVNLHAASGTGNAMGGLTNAAVSRSPLLLLAGQQVRGTVGQNVMLANVDAPSLTRPLTGFAAEPLSAEDVPRTVAEALHSATAGRRGPSYVSVPYDDWVRPSGPGAELLLERSVTRAFGVDPAAVDTLAERVRAARSPALVVGSDLDQPMRGATDPTGAAARLLAIVNDDPYGLSLGILSANPMAAYDLSARLESGMVHINDQTVDDEAVIPFGGIKASGTGGHFGGAEANLETFGHLQWVTMQTEIEQYPF